MRAEIGKGYVRGGVLVTTVAEIGVELECIGGPHALDARDYISVPVFVRFGDVGVVQVSSLAGKGNAPMRPPWRQ